jgi:hypothetical protein
MKITKSQLREIIREELTLLKESNIKNHVQKFISKLNKEFGDRYVFNADFGNNYARIVYSSNISGTTMGDSAWGFVALKTNPRKGYQEGDLLKSASWKAPAKHARGNIIDGTARYGKYGPEYLK